MQDARRLSPESHMFVVDIGPKKRGWIVFAHTLYDAPVMKDGCYTSKSNEINAENNFKHQCQVDVELLGPTIFAAANVLVSARSGEFLTASLPSTRQSMTINARGPVVEH